jgi:pimeloyl-ACP methyl ester carboxylesterase
MTTLTTPETSTAVTSIARLPSADAASSTVITDDGAHLAVSRRGPTASDGVVVLVHGWGASSQIWRPIASALEDQEQSVVLYDHRGHGASTLGTDPISIDRLGRDLHAVMEHLDLHDVTLVGHSGGGYSALSYLIDHQPAIERVNGFVGVATAAYGQKIPRPEQILMGSRVLSAVVRRPGPGAKVLGHTTGPACSRQDLDRVRQMFASTPRRVRGATFASTTGMDFRTRLYKLNLPTTMLAGEHDHVIDPRFGKELAAAIPGATFELIPGAGHMLPLEAHELLAARIHRVAGIPG